MLNGAISGLSSTVFNVPFQVIRTCMMIETPKNGVQPTMTKTIKKIYSKEGIKGFYRGFIPSLIRLPLGNAFYFGTLEHTKKLLNKRFKTNDIITNFISSAAGITVQSIVTNPIYLISTRFEAVGMNKYKNVFDAVKKILEEEGIKGFTKGLKPLLIKEIPSHSLFYVLYELNNKWIKKCGIIPKNLGFSLSSMITSIIVSILDNPFDLIRTRTQFHFISKNDEHRYPKVFEGIRYIYKNEGLKGLESGVHPRIIRKLFCSTALWTIYEILKNNENNKNRNQ